LLRTEVVNGYVDQSTDYSILPGADSRLPRPNSSGTLSLHFFFFNPLVRLNILDISDGPYFVSFAYSVTSSSAVTERPHDAPCCRKFCCVTQGHTRAYVSS